MIVLDDGTPSLPEGTKVRVETMDMDEAIRDLSSRLGSIAGQANNLPADLAQPHDHYIHGTPKR